MIAKLTNSYIEKSKFKKIARKHVNRDIRWDDTLPGFGLRIYPTGTKAFVVSFRKNGKKRLIVIGTTQELKLSKARIIYGEILDSLDK